MNQSQKLKTVHAGHVDVRDEAINLLETAAVEQLRAGAEQAHRVVSRFQEIFKRAQNAFIVINDCNDETGRLVGHEVLATCR